MSRSYLLQITLGPVQDFIAAARRTRDLWFGSTMLSEVSKAAARAVDENGGKLIFPAPESGLKDLEPNSALNVANVILAEVDEAAAALCAKAAKEAAQKRFRGYADEAFEKVKNLVVKERWDDQVEDFLEFYCAWTPVNGDYSAARKRVARLLAMRKNIRDFAPNPCKDRVPKSALDGLRESVFRVNPTMENVRDFPLGARIKPGECLDAIGLTRRLAGGRASFPSVSRTAVDSWIRGRGKDFLKSEDGGQLDTLCSDLCRLGVLSRIKAKNYSDFPYEGSVLFEGRRAAMINESRDNHNTEAVKCICDTIKSLIGKCGLPPDPYLVFLCADGDHMGRALSEMKSPEDHRNFSRELAKFSGRARKIVEDHQGVCVYTGGDDVLAFLPLDTALSCARRLHDDFGELMARFGSPTLSVGLSIAHAMEDLETLLEFGRGAETAAKKGADGKAEDRDEDRDGLAVSVCSRGNDPVTVRERWQTMRSGKLAEMPLDGRLDWWADLFAANRIPNKFPYELRDNAGFYDGWNDETPIPGGLSSAAGNDVMRIFNRKNISLETEDMEKIREHILNHVRTADDIRRLSDEMILAQWLAFGYQQVGGAGRREATQK